MSRVVNLVNSTTLSYLSLPVGVKKWLSNWSSIDFGSPRANNSRDTVKSLIRRESDSPSPSPFLPFLIEVHASWTFGESTRFVLATNLRAAINRRDIDTRALELFSYFCW